MLAGIEPPPGRPPQRALNAWTSSATERTLGAFGAKLTAAGAPFGSATIACARVR
jgi:hypothetical protein